MNQARRSSATGSRLFSRQLVPCSAVTALLLSALSGVANAQTRTASTPVAATTVITAKPAPAPAMCPPTDGTRPDPTLVNVDPFVLSRFPLSRVYKQLITLSGLGAPTAVDLYQQMWDSLDKAANAKFVAPHCDDNGSTINGFGIDCPRPEIVLKDTRPETFTPVALFNRFDLSSSDGAICGEYRIIYAMNGNISSPYPSQPSPSDATTIGKAAPAPIAGRDFIIFEGVLPNPKPGCGIEACRPVVKFWEDLAALDPSTAAGQSALADGLEQFYFKGLSGFEPVVHPEHYGVKGGGGYGQRSGGQIRTNMFVNNVEWQLREFHLVPSCDNAGCKLLLDPVTVKTNPHHELFNVLASPADPRAGAFQATFPAQSGALSTDQVALISMAIDDRYNAGQSTSQDFNEDYEVQFNNGAPPHAFSAAIDSELASLPTPRPDLSADDIARRATTQSCAGCHELSNGVPLGGKVNPTWPFSRRFVHVDESGFLSQALWCVFLPARKTVLDGFFASPSVACPTKPTPVKPVVVVTESQRSAPLPNVAPSALTIAAKIAGPN